MRGILSEFPYMALSFSVLVAYERTRTVAVALMAAIAACEALRYWRERDARRLVHLAWILGIPAAVAGLWIVLRPSSGHDAYVEFGARMAQDTAQQGAAWAVSMVSVNASALVDAWLNALLIFWGEWWKPGFLLACLIGATGLAATLWRAWRGEPDGLYCVAFLAIVLAWPFPGQMYRLALPVIPLAMANALWAWHRLLLRARTPEEPGAPGRKAEIAEFYRVPVGPAAASNALAQIEVFRDLERIRATTPESARVLWYAPAYVALLAQRHGARLERPRDAVGLAAQVRATRADFIYLANLHPRDSAHRLGHPLDPLTYAESLARVVWRRNGPGGDLRSVLLEIDRETILNKSKAP